MSYALDMFINKQDQYKVFGTTVARYLEKKGHFSKKPSNEETFSINF